MDEKVLLEWKEAPAYVYCLCCYLLFCNPDSVISSEISFFIKKYRLVRKKILKYLYNTNKSIIFVVFN